MPGIVYYSGPSGYTDRFITKLADHGFEPASRALRLPLRASEETPLLAEPPLGDATYILVTPTYGGGSHKRGGRTPKRVIEFLNIADNRKRITGVIGGGNRNFGADFAVGAKEAATRLGVPLIDLFEISGTTEDITRIAHRLDSV